MSFAASTRPQLQVCQHVQWVCVRRSMTRTIAVCNQHSVFRARLSTSFPQRFYSSSSKPAIHDLSSRSKKQNTLVFQSTSDNPYHNLAIEHFLLTKSDPGSHILLFYTNRPCVVIGRNQNPWVECNLKLIQDGINGKVIDLVRRRSGGGTVFHDEGNLNFSVIIPNDRDFSRRKHSELVVRALNGLHEVAAEYDGPEDIWVNERHDITMATLHNKGRTEFKVSGSAFKLTRGRALHHGTLLHSSPNLGNISKLLRSPGKDWIQAKGVESVRSPVANLFNVHNDKERDELRSKIMSVITQEFLKEYGSDVATEIVGDQDCLPDVSPDIAKGVDELMTDEWRFEQTPGFEFASRVIGGRQLTFGVQHGVIESPRLGFPDVSIEQRSRLEQQGGKLHEIRDWRDVFDQQSVDNDQLATVAQVFPNLKGILNKAPMDVHLNGKSVKEEEDAIVRRFKDGSVEKETGLNTVEVTIT